MRFPKNVGANSLNSLYVSKERRNVPSELKLTLSFVDETPNQQYRSFYSVFTGRLQEASFEDGQVGEKLERVVDFRDALKPGRNDLSIRIDETSGFDALGLSVQMDEGRLTIFGTPQFAFKVDFVISGRYGSLSQGREIYADDFDVRRSLSVGSPVVSQSLWEKHEPPNDAPYQTPNEQKDSCKIPLATVLAASRRGRSHEHVGAFRDDCFELKPSEHLLGWHVFAVADGAGSARFSRKGAKIACETLTSELSKKLNDPLTSKTINDALLNEMNLAHRSGGLATDYLQGADVLERTQLAAAFHQAVFRAYEAIQQEAKRFNASCDALDKKVSMRDFSTTALCVAMRRFKGQDGFEKDDKKFRPPIWAIVSYWIGDGALAIYRPNDADKVLLLGEPDGGEFAGQTQFLTTKEEIDSAPIRRRLRLAFVRNFRGIVMATDGISDPFFPSDSSLKKFERWRNFWKETLPKEFPGVLDKSKTPYERAEALLKGMEFWVKGNHDDRTLALILNDKLGD